MSFTLRAKRVLVGAMAGAMVLSLMPAGMASAGTEEVCANAPDSGFPDKGATHGDNIDCMFAYDVFQGRVDGTFGTFANITRGQAAAFFVNFAVAATAGGIEVPAGDVPFTDMGNVFDGEISALYLLGLVDGTSATTFSPAANITRGQFAKILYEAHVALGVDFDDEYDEAFPDQGDTFGAEIAALAGEGIISGFADGTFRPFDFITRGAAASLLAESAGVLDDAGLWLAPRLPGDIVPNQTFTANPELVEVTRSGDIVTFRFDQNVPGKSLDFFNTAGAAGSLVAGDEVSYYTGLRLYDVEGTAYYPSEAGIFGNEVRARYGSAAIVAAAVRAGVYENTVQNAVGRSNPASDFPLRATAVAPAPIDPYFPQLTFVGNLRDTQVTPAEILVDYRFTFENATVAEAVLDLVLPNAAEVEPSDFAIGGSAGQVFRAVEINNATRSGANVTVTVVMDPAIQDVPVSQLARGFVEEDAFDTATIGFPHILLSSAYGNITAVNGTTTDPDLRAVERGPGANQMRFIFDEGVSVPDGLNNRPDLFTVTSNKAGVALPGQRISPDSIGRSLIAADEAQVMIATFTTVPAGFTTVSDYLDTVTAAFVDAEWTDADRDVVAASAARGTDQVGSQQLGWALPAQVLVTPVQPEVPADPTPGVTELPDLLSVTKAQNAVTGNWSVTFTFDQTAVAAGTEVDFSLYDAEGVRFSAVSRGILFSSGTANAAGQQVFRFGPDVSTLNPVFTNEQIAASVLGTVQDADATLVDVGTFGVFEPRITEGHDGIS